MRANFFGQFVGKQLADLHIDYESVPAIEGVEVNGDDGKFYCIIKH